MEIKILLFILTFLVEVEAGTVQKFDYSKEFLLNNPTYLHFYRIPNSQIQFKSNGGELTNHKLSAAFDDDNTTYWESIELLRGNFLVNIDVSFSTTKLIDRIIFQAPTDFNIVGVGYPTELRIYYKLKTPDGSLDNDFLLVDDIISEGTGERVIFLLDEPLTCDMIRLEYVHVIPGSGPYLIPRATEITFLAADNEYINKLIFEVFKKDDYKRFIDKNVTNIDLINEIEENIGDILDKYNEGISDLLSRAKDMVEGKIKYNRRREFTSNQSPSSLKILYQRGDMELYTRNVLKMSNGGTNMQPTGITAFANELITIYVDANDNDPLPSIRFSQYIGTFGNWISEPIPLKKGINSLRAKEFDISEIQVKVRSGGPIYIENKYTSEEQSQNVKIYIEGGTLVPYFRINDNESMFKNTLRNYVQKAKSNWNKYYDIVEMYSDKISFTLNASNADYFYNTQGESPQKNLENWDQLMKYLYIFEGIQFEENEPYYDPRNEYINIYIRYSTNNIGKNVLAYAYSNHLGIFTEYFFNETLVSYGDKKVGPTLVHEIGHMIDVKPRELAEFTNLVLEEYNAQTLLKNVYIRERQEKVYEGLAPDNIDNSLRLCENKKVCKGFFLNAGGYVYPHYVWWNIESFYPGYWGKLNNLYRFNISLINGMNKNEGMVYLSSLIIGFDTSYHFERYGLAMQDEIVFKLSDATLAFNNSMNLAKMEGKISKEKTFKKMWYADDDQYNFTRIYGNNGVGCYTKGNTYSVKITKIINESFYITIKLPVIKCENHLGFEIIENGVIIGFTQEKEFRFEKIKSVNYDKKKYKIIAYDRLLNTKESEYKTLEL